MARLNVNPTRMTLSTLKKNLGTATRGHRLLKDKHDELMRRLLKTAAEARKLRRKTDEVLVRSKEKLRLAAAIMGEKRLETALLLLSSPGGVEVKRKNVMSVILPELEIEDIGEFKCSFGYLETAAELEDAVRLLAEIKGDLVRLAELEKTVALLSGEAERTGRRVNALEYVLIPDYLETMRYVRMKLDENERANSIRLLKVKDMVLEEKRRKKTKG